MAEIPTMNFDDSRISYLYFDSRDAMLNHINDPQFSLTIDSFCFAVVFNASQGTGKYNYELMFNTSSVGDSDFASPSLSAIDLLSRYVQTLDNFNSNLK